MELKVSLLERLASEAGGAEVFADVLRGGADPLGDAGRNAVLGDLGTVGDGPEIE